MHTLFEDTTYNFFGTTSLKENCSMARFYAKVRIGSHSYGVFSLALASSS